MPQLPPSVATELDQPFDLLPEQIDFYNENG